MQQDASILEPAQDVLAGDAPESLNRIWSQGCAAAIWRRSPATGFQNWIDAHPPERLPRCRILLKPEGVEEAIAALCDQCGLPESDHCHLLASDVGALAALFSQVMRTRSIRLRLDVVTDNACTKFHLDHVPARLLCTYRGKGTEYGPSNGGETPDRIDRLATGSVGLFRGELWPAQQRSAIVHRSPALSGSGETRLLLVIDVAE